MLNRRPHLDVFRYLFCTAREYGLIFFIFLVTFGVSSLVFGEELDSHARLNLNDSDIRYDINSVQEASGFFVCPEDMTAENMEEAVKSNSFAYEPTTRPDFKKNGRHCFYLKLSNETDNTDWILHLSNFFIDNVNIVLHEKEATREYRSDLSSGINNERINVIGRGFALELRKSKEYFLAVELSADGFVAPPYIGLMSEPQYREWSKKMDYVYSLSIGVILGLIVVALVCGAILRDVTFFWFGVSSLLLLFFFIIRSSIAVYAFDGIWGLPPWLWLLASASVISILLFSRSFLLSGEELSPLTQAFNVLIVASFVVLLLGTFFPKGWKVTTYIINIAFMMAVVFYAGCVKVLEKGRYYLLFMLGWAPVFFSLLELVAIVTITPERNSNTLSYKILREPFIQITHMLVHMAAMLIRIVDLKKQKYQAEMQNEAKSRFLASVSHDLRQPLHGMGLYLAHLNDHVKSKPGQDLLAKVYGLHTSMNHSFKTLMDLSRLEAGAVNPNLESVDLVHFIGKLRLEFEPHARANGIKGKFRSVGKKVYSDPMLLERIMRNLIYNAIKYTDTGGILVGCRVRDNCVLIQVWDTGFGISETDQKVIFDIYKRSEKVVGSHKGMGIGLAIVKHLVDLMGCRLELKSREARGSMFQVTLPLVEHIEGGAIDLNDSDDKPGCRIVLDVDDNKLYNQASNSLKSWGYLIDEEILDGQRSSITLVITDASEPLNHESLSDRIRSLKGRYGQVVMAVFINNAGQHLSDHLTELGVHFLSAQFRPAQLRSLIRYVESLPDRNSD